MNPCRECKGPKEFRIDPNKPEALTLWEAHRPGCSWSPLVAPTEVVNWWAVRDVPRTDGVPRTTSARKDG